MIFILLNCKIDILFIFSINYKKKWLQPVKTGTRVLRRLFKPYCDTIAIYKVLQIFYE